MHLPGNLSSRFEKEMTLSVGHSAAQTCNHNTDLPLRDYSPTCAYTDLYERVLHFRPDLKV